MFIAIIIILMKISLAESNAMGNFILNILFMDRLEAKKIETKYSSMGFSSGNRDSIVFYESSRINIQNQSILTTMPNTGRIESKWMLMIQNDVISPCLLSKS